jgi:hypothetical protein
VKKPKSNGLQGLEQRYKAENTKLCDRLWYFAKKTRTCAGQEIGRTRN